MPFILTAPLSSVPTTFTYLVLTPPLGFLLPKVSPGVSSAPQLLFHQEIPGPYWRRTRAFWVPSYTASPFSFELFPARHLMTMRKLIKSGTTDLNSTDPVFICLFCVSLKNKTSLGQNPFPIIWLTKEVGGALSPGPPFNQRSCLICEPKQLPRVSICEGNCVNLRRVTQLPPCFYCSRCKEERGE